MNQSNFWQKLPTPFLTLAPMEDVTDTVFRRVVARVSKPDVFFTEFVNVEGMLSQGQSYMAQRLEFTEAERPLVAQIWGVEPANFYAVAQDLAMRGFDGIDINMGCPKKKVVKKGACIALVNDTHKAQAIIAATKAGGRGLPVSVKTRLGFHRIVTEGWIGFLLGQDLAALTIHGRTAVEMSKVPPHWDEIGKAVNLRDRISPQTIIIGNGDVKDAREAQAKAARYGVDGVMIGRGIFHNLYAFDRGSTMQSHTQSEMLMLLLWHIRLFEKTWGNKKHFVSLRKFFKIYTQGYSGAKGLRIKLMSATSVKQATDIIEEVL